MERGTIEALVLGIGNLLWADEGFGVRGVEALQARYEFPEGVCLMDGGTQGLYLLPYVKAARRLLVFDAVDFRLPPGTLKVLRNDEVPAWGASKMSLHQVGFQEVLSIAALSGCYPSELVLVGVQPEEIEDFGGSLRDVTKTRVPQAVAAAISILAEWGFAARERATPPSDRFNLPCVEIERYEAERPAAEAACRVGDARFLNRRLAAGNE
jgi:hydrogenase maturation protease